MSKMKMSDIFDLPLDCLLVDNANIGYAVELECDKSVTEDQACAVGYAINNHDRMVEEIAELKEFVCSLQLDVSNEIKLENLLAKLNQKGEE